jgi:hypothetical protein
VGKLFILLGGGVNYDGSLPDHVAERVNYAVSHSSDNDSLIFSTLFTLNLPVLVDSNGFPFSEAYSMCRHYSDMGGKAKDLYLENSSFDTVGSAVFCALHFGWLARSTSEAVVITSEFHMPRSREIFTRIFNTLRSEFSAKLRFVEVANRCGDEALAARREHERSQLGSFISQSDSWAGDEDCLRWFFSEHDLYNTKFRSSFSSDARHFLY